MANKDFRDADEIQSKGGHHMDYMEVNADGTPLTTPDTWHSMPYRSKSDNDFKAPKKAVNDEGGAVIKNSDDNEDSTLTVTSLQDSAKLEKFIKYESRGKYYAIFMDCGPTADGARKERFIPIVEFERSYKASAPGRTPDIKMLQIATPDDITPASLPDWAIGKAADFKCEATCYDAICDSTKTVAP